MANVRYLFVSVALTLCIFGIENTLLRQVVLADESYYLAAAYAVLEGKPLAEVGGWFYPAPLAYIFAAILEWCGERALIGGLRVFNLIGMVTVWLVAARILVGDRPRLAVALVPVLAWASDLSWAFEAGNVSGIIALPLLVAMRPNATDRDRFVAMAASTLMKPYALGLALRERGAMCWGVIGVIALMSAMTEVGGAATEEFLGRIHHSPVLARVMLDVGLPWQVAPVLAVGLGMAAVRWDGEMTRSQGLVISWLALPVVWPHTTAALLLIPLAVAFRGTAREADSRRRLLRRLGVALLAIILLQENILVIWSHTAFLPWCGAVALFVLLRPRRTT